MLLGISKSIQPLSYEVLA